MRYAGASFVMHGGSIDGMTAWMTWSLEKDIGFVALTNARNLLFPAMLMFAAVNPVLGLPQDDVLGRMLELRDRINAGPVLPAVDTRLPPALAVDDLVGQYANHLGPIDIFLEKESLQLRIPKTGFQATLRHLNRDTYMVSWDNPALPVLTVSFRINVGGVVTGVTLESTDEFTLSAADGLFEKATQGADERAPL
jgi:hypothetical protein